MGNVFSHMTMSLDGFIADPQDRCDELFGWYDAGDVTVPSGSPEHSFHVDAASADMLREVLLGAGALVSGRRLFDIADGWGDQHPADAPVVVVTHAPPDDARRWPRTTFVDGVEPAIARAKEIAGDQDVIIASADVARQALDAGLLDSIEVSLVPVLLGSGIPYFAGLTAAPHRLGDPVVVQGRRATHLSYPVRRG